MTDADTVRALLDSGAEWGEMGACCLCGGFIDKRPHDSECLWELARAALDRLEAENEHLRQYADRGDFVVYRSEWDALVAERDRRVADMEAALERERNTFDRLEEALGRAEAAEAERDRLRDLMYAYRNEVERLDAERAASAGEDT